MKLFMSVCLCAMLVLAGCNNDDNVVDIPVDQAVETGMNQAMATTVVPTVDFMAAVAHLLAGPGAVAGLACPETGAWCTSGSATCTPAVTGLDFGFDQCRLIDSTLTLDGDLNAVVGATLVLTLDNLVINGSPAISGTGTVNPAACDYVVSIHGSDATVTGTVTQCGTDAFPTGDSLLIGFDDFIVTVTFDGSSTASATASRSGTPVAICSINLAASPPASSCAAP
ncbi:MAG TPA: hypothetical protein VFO11_10925 [Candidatus Polarisedimenticolaceae bacterium]|nr:hypothetical protein [Candidatus Polarisedimenticolaceae bacterium]